MTSLEPINDDPIKDDQLRIDTPEQIQLEFPLAGIGSRFLAVSIDTVLQTLLYVAGVLAIAASTPYTQRLAGMFRWLSPTWATALIVIFLFGVYWGYFTLFEIIWRGQTPGKRVAKIRVIKESGRPINAYEAIARNLLRAIDMLPTMYIVGLVTMMISSQNRRLGDYVAGSVVVHDKLPELIRPEWTSTPPGASLDSSISNSSISKVTPEELVLIETFLQRRWDLDPVVRMNTAHKIGAHISARTGIQRPPDQPIDDFLEGIAKQVRDGARLR